VHGARREARFVEVAAQRLGVRLYVIEFDRTVPEAPDGLEDGLAASGELLSEGVQLQRKRIACQGPAFRAWDQLPQGTLKII
jgi:hypothetical protein